MQVINYGILMLIFCTSTISAIRCYQCSYIPFIPRLSCKKPDASSSYLRTCPPGENYCFSTVTGASYAGISAESIERGCTDNPSGPCIGIIVAQHCKHTCSTDGCNTHDGEGNVIENVIGKESRNVIGKESENVIGNESKIATASFSTVFIAISISLFSFAL